MPRDMRHALTHKNKLEITKEIGLMAGRKIRRQRFRLMDELGFSWLCKFYVESSTSVKSLCWTIFDPTPDGRIGVSLFYQWIDKRGYRDHWEYTVAFKKKLLQDQLDKLTIELPDEIQWDRWEEDVAQALGMPSVASQTDEGD